MKEKSVFSFSESVNTIVFRLSRPSTVFYLLPLIMALLVSGTVAQRYVGLYDATSKFFSSWFFLLGPIPLPGGYTLIGLLTLALLLKFLFYSRWTKAKAGINLTHLGVLVLLLGGLVTSLQSKEGVIVLAEGESSNVVQDYHKRQLFITSGDKVLLSVPHGQLHSGLVLTFKDIELEILGSCSNCEIVRRDDSDGNIDNFRGPAQFMALKPQRREMSDEENNAGVTFRINGADEESNGSYATFELMPKPVILENDGESIEIRVIRELRHLPFEITLERFEREMYPGTSKAKSYMSDITVHDDGFSWPARIEMNEPLRYKGYTFFQSSFIDSGQDVASVLAVVQNKGWVFPYAGTLIMVLGLLFHLFIMMAGRGRKA